MSQTVDTYLLLRAFVDELARSGVAGACTSPGSRSTPLVLSLVRDGRLPCWSHIDERAGAFFGLGVAKATGRPVVLACTSGTAAANYLPAVVEAAEARVPLIVLTTDRPPELRQIGAGQTIDQIKLYGAYARWFFEVGTHPATPERLRWMRALACRAVAEATGTAPGPVHLNVPLREPLVLADGEELPEEPGGGGRPDGRPWLTRVAPAEDPAPAAQALVQLAGAGRRGVVVAGRHERGRGSAGPAAAAFAAAAGWPLLADPLSGARRGPAAVAHYDLLLRHEAFAAATAPEVVVRVGDLPTSKPLRGWLARPEVDVQVALDPEGAWQDPASAVDLVVPAQPGAVLEAAAAQVAAADPGYLGGWRRADELAAGAVAEALGDELSEQRVAALLGGELPPSATLFVSASMPIRDVETVFPVRDDGPRVLSNRGANGIDGVVSTAFGVAAGSDGPVVLLIGDVALAHDLGGLLAAHRTRLPLTVVLLDNGGGGIFDFLPVASQADAYEEHVATPTGLDPAQVAALFGLRHHQPRDVPAFRGALDDALASEQTTLIEVRSDRAANLREHRRVADAVVRALSA